MFIKATFKLVRIFLFWAIVGAVIIMGYIYITSGIDNSQILKTTHTTLKPIIAELKSKFKTTEIAKPTAIKTGKANINEKKLNDAGSVAEKKVIKSSGSSKETASKDRSDNARREEIFSRQMAVINDLME